MNLKTKFTTIAAASIFALSLGTSALAENTVTQVITGGSLTASITDTTLSGAPTYSDTAQTASGNLTLTVDDQRGSYAGWSINISSTNFIYDGVAEPAQENGFDILATGFAITTPGAPTTTSSSNLAGVTAGSGGTLDTARTTITATTGSGSGTYTQVLPVTLAVPAHSPAGTYTATLTVETSAAPS